MTLRYGTWGPLAEDFDTSPPDDTPLNCLNITMLAQRILETAGVKTAGEIRALGPKGLLALPGLGRATLKDLQEIVFAP